MGHVALRVADDDNFVADLEAGGIDSLARLGLVRGPLGLGVDDQPLAGFDAASAAGLGRLSRAALPRRGATATRAGARHCNSMLRSVDHSQLRYFPQIDSAAFEFRFGIVGWQQRQL